MLLAFLLSPGDTARVAHGAHVPSYIIRGAEASDQVARLAPVDALLKELGEEGDKTAELGAGRLGSLHRARADPGQQTTGVQRANSRAGSLKALNSSALSEGS